MDGDLLIYGAYGYTGSLITSRAVSESEEPIIAGRRAEPLEAQALEFGLDHRVFSLEHPPMVQSALEDVDAVLNCAGPFSDTAEPLLEACLETGTDYLDIAARIDVLESLAERDREAEKAGVTVLPAVGFDTVATDGLVTVLNSELPDIEQLTLALDGLNTFSSGTVKSIIDSLDQPGAVRENGTIRSVPVAWKTRMFDFGAGTEKTGVTVPWGAISTVYYATGIRNIETYATVPELGLRAMQYSRPLTPILALEPFQRLLKTGADVLVSNPTADERARSTVRLWGEATTADGDRAVARLTTPDTYDLTAATAVESARRVLSNDVEYGFQTPGTTFDADFVTTFEGTALEHVETIRH